MQGRVKSIRAGLIRCWEEFWFGRLDPLPAEAFRVFFGLLLAACFLAYRRNWDNFYAADGFLSLTDPALHRDHYGWTLFAWTDGFISVQAYWWVGLLSSLAFMLGWQARAAAFLLYLIQTSMIYRNIAIVDGGGMLRRTLLFYALFYPFGRTLSLSERLFSRKPALAEGTPSFPAWPARSMQVYAALVYGISVINKLFGDRAWWTGDAVYWVLMQSAWGRWPWYRLFYLPGAGLILTKCATYGTLLIEGGFPILVWFKKTRRIWIAAATLQITIALATANITSFNLTMACALLLFAKPEDLRAVPGLKKLVW